MVIAPIYKDTIFTYNGKSITYEITLDNAVIFRGKAYAAPNDQVISININRICENYLNNNNITPILNRQPVSVIASEAFRTFYLTTSDSGASETYKFLYNYDYGGTFNPEGMALSDPITGKNAVNMIPVRTFWGGTEVINMIDSTFYPDTVCGAEYCLYYLNAKGGWDALVIEGYSTRIDKVNRHQYNKTYNNQTIEYEKNTYISEIESSWKLNTGLLDDEQAHKLCWHLLSSNRVYLHDLIDDKIYPVVITNTQNVYNTYENNGHQPIQYEIDITESQTKLRQ